MKYQVKLTVVYTKEYEAEDVFDAEEQMSFDYVNLNLEDCDAGPNTFDFKWKVAAKQMKERKSA